MAAQGNYDHPSYLTRQAIGLGVSTAGANGTSGGHAFISNMRLRKVAVTVRTAGTSATTGNSLNLMCLGTYLSGYATGLTGTALTTTTGTNTLAQIALGSTGALTVTTSTDINVNILAGSVLFYKNGTDATGVCDAIAEMYLDPQATWTGPPGN
jgi:hypothetical protein